MSSILKLEDLSYSYNDGDNKRVILDHINMEFEDSKFYAIIGESGSGKTTLLSLISGLDYHFEGQIFYKDVDIKTLKPYIYRRQSISMIFQNYNLLNHLNAIDNIAIAMNISSNVDHVNYKSIKETLKLLGINDEKAKRKVNTLSGGEQQRVAIARSILMNTKIIVADEPTGNLDSKASESIIEILEYLAHKLNRLVILVTHNKLLINKADYICELKDGKLNVL